MASTVKANKRLLDSNLLPPCKGPKLHAFADSGAPITFLELLERRESYGFQAYVFKVLIKSRVYALKVFKFYKPSDGKALLSKMREEMVTDELAAFHCDPFYAECRAYGRIEELKKQGIIKRKVAAECYGFLGLRASEEEEINRMGAKLWDLPKEDDYRKRAEGSPARAIVKEFIEGTTRLGLRTSRHMLQSLRLLNEHGIYLRDFKRENYKAGVLLDFGSSWTTPHSIMDSVPDEVAEIWKSADMQMFDDMLEECNLHFRLRAEPNTRYQMKLRSWASRNITTKRGTLSRREP
ncbi:kinetochore Sim4 complex subunit FTA2-domain-containing protein [Hypoxylon argillaceum]|nr:kinetochore Sim4 complex subunit FTA2-domain-containing protein [Hypoxylon argillaceum]